MFKISNGGVYARHDASFRMNRPNGFDTYVLLLTLTKAAFRFADKEYLTGPYQAVIIAPHVPYSYYNPSGKYVDDWLHFTCDEEDLKLIAPAAFNKPFSVYSPSFEENCIKQILFEKNYGADDSKEENADMLFKVLLSHLMNDFKQDAGTEYSPYLKAMQELRIEMQSAPREAGSALEAANKLGISLSYFQHLYTDFFKTSYQKDLIHMKIAYGEELLRTTDMSVEEIAMACGYSSPIHFYRQFKALQGVTPGSTRI